MPPEIEPADSAPAVHVQVSTLIPSALRLSRIICLLSTVLLVASYSYISKTVKIKDQTRLAQTHHNTNIRTQGQIRQYKLSVSSEYIETLTHTHTHSHTYTHMCTHTQTHTHTLTHTCAHIHNTCVRHASMRLV